MISRCLTLTAALIGGLLVATTGDVAQPCWERDTSKPANASFVRDGPTHWKPERLASPFSDGVSGIAPAQGSLADTSCLRSPPKL